MNAIRKALAVTLKDLQIIAFGDRGILISIFILPIAISIFAGAIFGGGDAGINIPVIVVNEDSGGYGDTIVEVLKNIEELSLQNTATISTAEEKVTTGEFMAAVIIPSDFSQSIDAYQTTEVTVSIDPAQAQYGHSITTIVE